MLTQQKLQEALSYDKESGLFVWLKPTGNRVQRGASAGGIDSNGYGQIMICGKRYLAHRLAWLHANGTWPDGCIDHINGVKSDNRIINLRDVNRATNMQNIKRANVNNKTGFLGVHAARNKWLSQIKNQKQVTHLGVFSTPELAHQAYLNAKRIHHAGCTI